MVNASITLREIGNTLADAGSVLLFPHVNPDPDAMGSCAALCRVLRQLGKEAWILTDQPVPSYIGFLTKKRNGKPPLATTDQDVIPDPDVCICIDCGEENRIPGRMEKFLAGREQLVIDHHRVSECPWPKYYIDPDAPAAAQIIWQLLQEMEWKIDKVTAEALFTGIAGDTGSFQYSNTTPECHRIAAQLMELGADFSYVNVKLFQSVDHLSMLLRAHVIQKMEMLAGGRAVIACLSNDERENIGAGLEHTDLIIDDLRNIDGVELAAFVKEDGEKVRVNLRSKSQGNVAKIAKKFGGGGHIKAAGFMTQASMDDVYASLREELILAADALEM